MGDKEAGTTPDEMIRRLIDLKIEPIFNSLNWNYTKDIKINPRLLKTSKNTITERNLSKWM